MRIPIGVFFLICFMTAFIQADPSKNLQDLHKEVGEKLLELRTKYPESQPQVYAVLDKVGKLHTQAQTVCQLQASTEKKLAGLELAHKATIDELASLKSKFAQARSEVEAANKKFLAYQAEQQKKGVEKVPKKESSTA